MATTRPRSKVPFRIHHDHTDKDELDEDREATEDSKAENAEEDPEEYYSEDSDESDDVVDGAVEEDMLRFQETFIGIKDRFRLINRIGEG
jgi:cell division control protein 7